MLTAVFVSGVFVHPVGQQGEFRARSLHLASGYFDTPGNGCGRIPGDGIGRVRPEIATRRGFYIIGLIPPTDFTGPITEFSLWS
jgi:hypothetical protein